MLRVMRRVLLIVLLELLLSSSVAANRWRGVVREHLQDPKTPEEKPLCRLPIKFDQYANIRWSDEKARLDNFVIQLMKHAETVGYIIVYAGQRATVAETQIRANRARNYLIKVRKIDPQRVKAIDAGHKEDSQVDLWIWPANAETPPYEATVDPGQVEIIDAKKRTPKKRH